jgi:CspA family cold shock protein
MATGVVKWYMPEKGFGFIIPDDGTPEVCVESTGIAGNGFEVLEDGQNVEFDVVSGSLGRRAVNARPIAQVDAAMPSM